MIRKHLTLIVASVVAFVASLGEKAVTLLERNFAKHGLILYMANPLATEGNRLGDFLLFEDDFDFSRDAGTLVTGQNLVAGAVLGFIGTGTMGTVAAAGTGNGVCTKDATTPVLAGAKVGSYVAKCVLAATNKGLFEVIDPLGRSIGMVNVGDTFAREIKFAIADGATDFVAGDTFTFPVLTVSGKYSVYDPAATDGSQWAVAVLINDVDATSADLPCAVIARNAVVKQAGLTWKASMTAQNKANGLASLYDRSRIRNFVSA